MASQLAASSAKALCHSSANVHHERSTRSIVLGSASSSSFAPLANARFSLRNKRRSAAVMQRSSALPVNASLPSEVPPVGSASDSLLVGHEATWDSLVASHDALVEAVNNAAIELYVLADTGLLDPAALEAAKPERKADWLAPIADALQHTLERITLQLHAAGVDEAAGLAIITVTILTKMITYPFTKKQVESTMASANLQPVIKAIKARYGEDKEKVQAETSRVFKDAGVNPLAGCLPSIIQLPVFWGLYRALTNAAADNDFNEPFFFIPNLSGPGFGEQVGTTWLLPLVNGAPPIGWEAAAPYLVLPALVTVGQLISSEIIKAPVPEDESGKRTAAVLKVLPLMLGWFALNVPAGLALYWLSNTVLTTATQAYLRFGGGANPVVGKMKEAPKVPPGSAMRVKMLAKASLSPAATQEGGIEAPAAMAAVALEAPAPAPISAEFAGADVGMDMGFAGDMPGVAPSQVKKEAPKKVEIAAVVEASSAELAVGEADSASPAPLSSLPPLVEFPFEMLNAAVSMQAERERYLKSLVARQCKRTKDPAQRVTQANVSSIAHSS